MMQLTMKAKLLPIKEHADLLKLASQEYIRLVNQVVTDCIEAGKTLKYTSATVPAALPSAVKNQAIRDGKSVYRKYRKTKIQSILKKPVCIWNNQNWKLKEGMLCFSVLIEGKSKRIAIPVLMTNYQLQQLDGNKLGALRITQKSGKWIAQIAVEKSEPQNSNTKVMGVDLGLKMPAAAVTEDGKTRFFGNGRQNKYMKRKFRSQRKKLGKQKKLSAIRKLDDKEQRWMKDQDHKISRQIVDFAISENVGIIHLEALSGIRQTARTSRKNEKNLHTWSFYRLAQYIEYKARMEGIIVQYVNPKYTSQKCPACGTLNKAKDRDYRCSCGYHTHRDRLGAINIISAPVIDGKSLSA
jgi:IS605 OrfB family transposase